MYPSIIQEYRRPRSVQEAVAAINDGAADASFIAGGQSLMQALKARLVQPHALVDLQDVAELKGVSFDGAVRIGAMTRYVDLVAETRLAPAYAALLDAAAHVGDRQVRNRGTIGGSICWNYIAACMPAVALTLDATMNLVSGSRGERSLPAREFIGAPLETARKDDELLVSLQLPAPPVHAGSAYRKWSLVSDGLPVIGACVYVELDGGSCSQARVGFGGLASGPRRSPAAEAELVGCKIGDDEAVSRAMAAAAQELETQGDLWADPAYRSQLIRTLGARMAATAFRRASGQAT
ncbi:MAG TPA: FAD binding domain-containing protein [Geminicoccaceae bacterium]|jgi:carbon-monoxide dehydrogenase medium subunit|nr:FAD binding domain-containing protein [Geminicoccaceae bacterium]